MVTILGGYRVSFSMLLSQGPWSSIYGGFHIPFRACKHFHAMKERTEVVIWKVKEDEKLRFRKRKKQFPSSTPGAVKWQRHINLWVLLEGVIECFHFLKHVPSCQNFLYNQGQTFHFII